MSDVTFFRSEALPYLEAKVCSKRELCYQKHFHDEYSIGLIDSGATKAWCEGVEWQVNSGQMISFPPHMLHACQSSEHGSWKYKMLFIKPQWLEQLEIPSVHELQLPFLLDPMKNKLCSKMLNKVMVAFDRSRAPLELESALIELIYHLVSKPALDLEHQRKGKAEHQYVKRIKEYIHTHYNNRITLDELEHVAGISRYHLIRIFKKSTHLPPHAYQNLLRINSAKKALKGGHSIADIAVASGFYDQSHFSKAFTRIVGATPQVYTQSL